MDERDIWKHSPQLVAQARSAAYLRRANRAIAASTGSLARVAEGVTRALGRINRD